MQALVYLSRWPSVLVCVALSIAASGIVVFGIIFQVFPFAPAPIVTVIAGIFGNVFSALPITLGGVGVGESAFLAVAHELSGAVAPYASIYLTFRVLMLVANIPGGTLAIYNRIWRWLPNAA